MIFLPRALLKEIVDAAEAAHPRECCGLLVGHARPPADLEVTRVVPSPNVVEVDAHERFEVSPQLRFELMRELADGPERVIGLYHSHPGHAAQPSEHDLLVAWEPDLVWLITAVMDGQAIHTTAHALDPEGRQFRHLVLRTTDWEPYPSRPAQAARGDGGDDDDD